MRVEDWAAMIAVARAAKVERVVEQAIQGGEHGVLAWVDQSDQSFHVEVSHLVPYGRIYEFPRGIPPGWGGEPWDT